MDILDIIGGTPLCGDIAISGAKNAALPLMCTALLTDAVLILNRVPQLVDIRTLSALLVQHGVAVDSTALEEKGILQLRAKAIASDVAPYELVRKMRASVLVLGPLLARHGSAKVSLPGGCAIGTRPVDLHLHALERMGATVHIEAGYIHALAPDGGLRGAEIALPHVSVGATENIMMAASLAHGVTTLLNAAREPEVVDLAICLQKMGARIDGVGTDKLVIEGVPRLHGTAHTVMADRIETGTYAIAAAMTGGDLRLLGAETASLRSFLDVLSRAGVTIQEEAEDVLRISADGRRPIGRDVMTEPHPGFPTDLQAQYMAWMTLCDGAAMITETIFENRFMHVPELVRMGAQITVHGSSALVRGTTCLKGAPVMASDLRASAALVLAGLAAEGQTSIHRIYHLDRGYENMLEKLNAVGAQVTRRPEEHAA